MWSIFVIRIVIVQALLGKLCHAAQGAESKGRNERRNLASSAVNESARETESDSVTTGSLFAGRFRMVAILHREKIVRMQKDDVKDPMPLPEEVSARFGSPEFIQAGNFGEVWKAEDTKNDNHPVALKMFFQKDEDDETKHMPLTLENIEDDSQLMSRVRYASMECKLAQSLEQFSQRDPAAASRFMRCYEDHADPSQLGKSDPIYQVFEYCGTTDLVMWMQDNRDFAKSNPKEYVVSALLVFAQLMQALHYLTRFNVRFCHHDLKPENIMIKEGTDGKDYIKLIDFGSMTEMSRANSKKRAVSSPAYAEPDWFNEVGNFLIHGSHWLRGYNADNPASFDVYAVGAILDEMITGTSTYSKWKVLAKHEPQQDFYSEMCKRQRLFNRLEDMPSSKISVSKALARVKRYEKKEVHVCHKWLRILQIKGKNGIEPRMTKDWGKGGDAWAEQAKVFESSLDKLLYCDECVDEHFRDAVDQYKRLVQPYNWSPTFMKMMAFDPLVRPEPTEVMRTPLLQKLMMLSPPQVAPENLFHDEDMPSLIEKKLRISRGEAAFRDRASALDEDAPADGEDDAFYILADHSMLLGTSSSGVLSAAPNSVGSATSK